MTFLLNAKYAAEAPSPSYPVRGSIKNDSSPGAEDGTALDSQWKDDERAIWEILLQNAAITPSGFVDTAIASDLYDAFLFAISATYSPLKNNYVNERKTGSDGNTYKCLIDNGPDILPANPTVDPVGDLTGTWIPDGGIGVLQTPQDVSGSRAYGVPYTNTEGRTINLSIVTQEAGSSFSTLTVDGVVVGESRNNAGTSIRATITFPVPDQAIYTLTGSGNIIYWSEPF